MANRKFIVALKYVVSWNEGFSYENTNVKKNKIGK